MCNTSEFFCLFTQETQFEVYRQYCTHHDGAVKILREIEKKPEMMSFLQEFKLISRQKLEVRDYLIKPIQRICRYPLLLKVGPIKFYGLCLITRNSFSPFNIQGILQSTSPDCLSYKSLEQAQALMQRVASTIDWAKWYVETLEKTDTFFSRLEVNDRFDAETATNDVNRHEEALQREIPFIPSRSQCGELLFGSTLFVGRNRNGTLKVGYRVKRSRGRSVNYF